ncbi:MAG: DNA-deoxyinosine glycosylase [Clostridiales bacterium]|nr:MAG: DNA-deoxyinosine glycosylase [Clostridiales bacterium]
MNKRNTEKQIHSIPPFWRPDSERLILGSFPSVKSREQRFFYAHPQNRFWRVTAAVFDCDPPAGPDEKVMFLEKNRIALWDVIAVCEISGSSDSSIRNAAPNRLERILENCQIRRIFVNGKAAQRLYVKYLQQETGKEAILLPSTSPANAAWTLPRLIDAWRVLRED